MLDQLLYIVKTVGGDIVSLLNSCMVAPNVSVLSIWLAMACLIFIVCGLILK